MDDYFFSKDNVNKLSGQLGKVLNIKNTPDSKRACSKFVESQMKNIYDKYSDKRPKKMPIPEFLSKLNQKTLEDCIKLYEVKTGKKTNNYGSMNMQRDKEIYGGREQMMNSRPQHTSGNSESRELPGMMDSMSGGNFAPISSFNSPGEYITATGEMGSRMNVGGSDNYSSNDQQTMFSDKKGAVDDLERRMLERQNDYQARPMNMGSFNNFNGGGSNYDNNFMYNPGQFNNQKPQEINFALDGGDTRRTKEREDFIRQATGGQNMQQNDMMGNFGFMDFDGNMGGGMNFDMMGMGLMGNNLSNNMQQNNMMPNNTMYQNNMQQNNMHQNNMHQNNMMNNNMMNNNMINNNMMNNNMMNNNMMQNNMVQQNGNQRSSRNPEQDLTKKLNDMMQDRNSVSVQKNGKFNPMMSPSMINMQMQNGGVNQMLQNQQTMSGQNNLNFQKGGKGGSSDNLIQITNVKESVASSYGIDLKKIQTMSSRDIAKLIDKIKNNVMIGAEEIANKGSENIEKSDKRKLLDLIKQEKKINKKQEKELTETSSDVYEEKPVNTKTVKFNEPKNTDKTKDNLKVESKKSKLISINAEEYTDPEYFNDYLIELPEEIKNIVGIEVLDYSFPSDLSYINKNNNQLVINFNNEEKVIELENGNYSINEIVEGLQNAFEADEMNINIDIDDNEHIVLSSTDTEFSFKNNDRSLAKLLGFTEKSYNGERVYISENKHMLVSKIYLYIDNISNNEPFGVIDLQSNKTHPLTKRFVKPIGQIKEMILKFKRRRTNEDDLIEFNRKPHRLTFKFESKN